MIARGRRCRVRPSFAGTSGDRDELPGGFDDDGLRIWLIVPAPNGARCLEVPADAPLWQEFRSAVSTERLNRPSANRKRPRSISRGFQSIRGAICGAVGAAESSTRHRHACGPVGGQPARAPLVREPPWLDHVLDAADLSAPRLMRVAVQPSLELSVAVVSGRPWNNPHRLSLSRVPRSTRSPYDAPPRFVIRPARSALFVSRSMNSCSLSAMGTMTSVVSGCR